MEKWCTYCAKSDHNDTECWCTRAMNDPGVAMGVYPDGFAIRTAAAAVAFPCNCRGPQNGEPKCPCMMKGIVKRNGRWIQLEVDLGAAQ